MAGKNKVLVNGMTVVTEKSGGRVVGMPDFCQVPTPAGPQLTPFTNTAEASALEKGSTSVTIGDASVCLSNSSLASSTGNEAGTLGLG